MFGIHIGNTNASIASCKENGKATLITNEGGQRLTPAVVTVTDEGICVGATAQVDRSSKTMSHNKSAMRDKLDKNAHQNHVETQVENDEISYCIPLTEKIGYVTPKKVPMLIFKQLLTSAKSALCIESAPLKCVLLMPVSFSEDYGEHYKQAAESAGWKVLQVINESAAAILAYSLLDSKEEPDRIVIVYRLGGTTCEITGCMISNGIVSTIGSVYKEDIGGNLFTDVIANFFADEFYKKYKLDPRERRRSLEKLKEASQNCVHILSNLPMSNCLVESLHEGLDLSVNLSRARFELLIKPTLQKCIDPLQMFLDEFKLNRSVDSIILCGGGANVPSLQQAISSLFEGTTTEVLAQRNLEEVLAIGGAKQAYYLAQDESVCSEMLPRSMDITVDATDFIDYICC